MYSKLFCFSLIFAGMIIQSHCAIMRFTGECPDGHKPGDTWYKGCGQCDCHEKGYSCYSCGVYSLQIDTTSCYIYHEDEKLYPECCQPKTKCRGEEGFREELVVG